MSAYVPTLTLHQPWASLIACGAKGIETRSWRTDYRGPIAIHAGAKRLRYCEDRALALAVAEWFGEWSMLPHSAILAVGWLQDCWRMEYATDGEAFALDDVSHARGIPPRELPLGDYTPGRWAWVLRDVRLLRVPVPCAGHQGLWRCTLPEVLAAAERSE